MGAGEAKLLRWYGRAALTTTDDTELRAGSNSNKKAMAAAPQSRKRAPRWEQERRESSRDGGLGQRTLCKEPRVARAWWAVPGKSEQEDREF